MHLTPAEPSHFEYSGGRRMLLGGVSPAHEGDSSGQWSFPRQLIAVRTVRQARLSSAPAGTVSPYIIIIISLFTS